MGFFKEFKEFITKGNAIDLAVGVIIGGAFSALVNAIVENIFSPLIGAIVGKVDLANTLILRIGDAEIKFGALINAIIVFLLTALVLFLLVKAINKARKLGKKKCEEEAANAPAPEPTAEEKLLTEIRDLLKK